jgi:hypothetical protein
LAEDGNLVDGMLDKKRYGNSIFDGFEIAFLEDDSVDLV